MGTELEVGRESKRRFEVQVELPEHVLPAAVLATRTGRHARHRE